MSTNTIDTDNQLLAENATLKAEIARLNEQLEAAQRERDEAQAELKRRDAQEPVAWQFLDDGKWFTGSGKNNHRQNTEAAGYPVRNLYAAAVNSPVIPDGCKPYTWIESREIPDSVIAASYDSGAGPAICAVAEVDDELQAKGYPALCWAYLDVVPGMMIDRATNCNITNHVVRWLPVKRVTA